jgi:hypothetical protein
MVSAPEHLIWLWPTLGLLLCLPGIWLARRRLRVPVPALLGSVLLAGSVLVLVRNLLELIFPWAGEAQLPVGVGAVLFTLAGLVWGAWLRPYLLPEPAGGMVAWLAGHIVIWALALVLLVPCLA